LIASGGAAVAVYLPTGNAGEAVLVAFAALRTLHAVVGKTERSDADEPGDDRD
jgi:hypothetical protein